jgi:hypothetical protein
MRSSLLFIFALFVSGTASAAGTAARSDRLMLGATYNQLFFNPADINIAASQLGTSPAYPNLTGGCGYSVFIDYRLLESISLRATYSSMTIKNLVATDDPVGTDGGFDLSQNMVTADLNYYLWHNRSGAAGNFMYLGGSAGTSLTNDITLRNENLITHYTLEKATAFGGQLGLGLYMGNLVVLLQAKYLSHKIPAAKTSSGSYLTHQNGNSVRSAVDYSGVTTSLGIALSF